MIINSVENLQTFYYFILLIINFILFLLKHFYLFINWTLFCGKDEIFNMHYVLSHFIQFYGASHSIQAVLYKWFFKIYIQTMFPFLITICLVLLKNSESFDSVPRYSTSPHVSRVHICVTWAWACWIYQLVPCTEKVEQEITSTSYSISSESSFTKFD